MERFRKGRAMTTLLDCLVQLLDAQLARGVAREPRIQQADFVPSFWPSRVSPTGLSQLQDLFS
jgi:hypothetical protein